MARKPAASKVPKATGPKGDKREAKRFTLILRAGKLVTEHGEFLCVLRDVSAGGLKARLFHPLPDPGACELELPCGERYRIEAAWQNGDHVGFRFAGGPVDVHGLLEEVGPFPKRHIRLRLRAPMPLLVLAVDEGLTLACALHDISQHGAALESEVHLAIGQKVRLIAEPLGRIEARVRWRRGSLYGVIFQQGFRLDELARLAAALQLEENNAKAQGATTCVNQ